MNVVYSQEYKETAYWIRPAGPAGVLKEAGWEKPKIAVIFPLAPSNVVHLSCFLW